MIKNEEENFPKLIFTWTRLPFTYIVLTLLCKSCCSIKPIMSWEWTSKEASANSEGDLQRGSGLIYTLKFKDKSGQLGVATVMDSIQKVKRKQLAFNNVGRVQGSSLLHYISHLSILTLRKEESTEKKNYFSLMFPGLWLSCPATLLYLLQQLNLYSMTL